MSKVKDKPRAQQAPPTCTYPTPPHIIGMDWIELPVRSPAHSASRYLSIGFSPRGSTGPHRAVAIGGTVIHFKRARGMGDPTGRTPTGILLQMPVDHIELKRRQLIELGLKPGAVGRRRRGDMAFEWRDDDGHTIRFVGPVRRPDDEACDG